MNRGKGKWIKHPKAVNKVNIKIISRHYFSSVWIDLRSKNLGSWSNKHDFDSKYLHVWGFRQVRSARWSPLDVEFLHRVQRTYVWILPLQHCRNQTLFWLSVFCEYFRSWATFDWHSESTRGGHFSTASRLSRRLWCLHPQAFHKSNVKVHLGSARWPPSLFSLFDHAKPPWKHVNEQWCRGTYCPFLQRNVN